MMLTEDEAKQKWCPRLPDQRDKCIASACMAWRWGPDACRHKERGTIHDIGAMNAQYSDASEYERLPASGFCGLAGQP
jgi:hypothetical protein